MELNISLFKNKKNNQFDNDVADSINEFKSDLFSVEPFYGEILSRIKIVESDTISTAATNGLIMLYNKKFFSKLSSGERNFVIMHELFHIVLMHCIRESGRNPQVWNIAADYIVNSMLNEYIYVFKSRYIPFAAPKEGCFFENAYRDYSVETMYNKLYEENNEMISDIIGNSDLIVANSQSEAEGIKAKISEIVNDAASHWGNHGTGLAKRVINKVQIDRRLPWKYLLRKMWVRDEEEECSYVTPERKYLHMGNIMPGWGRQDIEKLQDLWVFIDSSGSIDDATINSFLSQAYVISKDLGARLNIAYWDCYISDVYRNVDDPEQIASCVPHHSGGTDPSCIYHYISDNKINPNGMIIFTDGEFGDDFDNKIRPVIKRLFAKTIVVVNDIGTGAHNKLGKEARI